MDDRQYKILVYTCSSIGNTFAVLETREGDRINSTTLFRSTDKESIEEVSNKTAIECITRVVKEYESLTIL